MSDEECALLAAVAAAPDDDVPRLVYADWLDEHDRPERAEFVRLQIAWHQAHADPARFHTRNRVYNLLQDHVWAHGSKCEDRPPVFEGVTWEAAVRGFVETATVRAWELADRLPAVLAAPPTPLIHLDFHYRVAAELTGLLDAAPGLTVRRVTVSRVNTWPPGWEPNLAGEMTRLATADWPPVVDTLRLGPVFTAESVAPFLPVPTGRYLPKLDLRAVRGLSDPDRLRLRTRFGDRVLLP
jgi:uncharacterized protein (TIGR02996 family)